MPDSDSTPSQPRPGTQPSAPSASHYMPELPYAEELQALLEGRYIVESFLGQGGMGAVYRGLQMPLKRPVAIKILAKQQAGVQDDFDFEERFKREAYAMAALTHPNIVQVYDCGDAGEHFLFISMELVEGGDLSDAIKNGSCTPEAALAMIGPICDGLGAAHDRGLVHRDIKPANIFLTADGKPKVADFGLAKKFDVKSTFVTKTGMGMGTPDYAAPEQYEGVSDIDHRADIYALGVMFYQMLTGNLPRGAYKPPSQRVAVDPRLDAVVTKAMEPDRAERYQSVAAMKADVQQILATWMAARQQPAAAGPSGRAPTAGRPSAQAPMRTGSVPTNPRTASTLVPEPEKSGGGLLLGIFAAVAVIGAGAFFMMKKAPATDTPTPTSMSEASASAADSSSNSSLPTSVESRPSVVSSAMVKTNGNSPAFSNFAPGAVWRDEFNSGVKWNVEWQRVGPEMHIIGDKSGSFLTTGVGPDSGLRVRYRSRKKGSYLDVVQRADDRRGGRYVVTIWANEFLRSGLDIVPIRGQGNRHPLKRIATEFPVGTDVEHTAEFYAIGDNVTFFFDGKRIESVTDRALATGVPGVLAGVGTELVSLETTTIGGGSVPVAPALATNPTAPAMAVASAASPAPAASASASSSPVAASVAASPATQDKGWINLISTADPVRDSLQVPWTIEGGVLRSPEQPRGTEAPQGHTVFAFPIAKPVPDYDLRLRITRESRGFTLVAGFFTGAKQEHLCMAAEGGFNLWGQPLANRERVLFKAGETHDLRIEVRGEQRRFFYDDTLLTEAKGDTSGRPDGHYYRPQDHQERGRFLSVGVCAGRLAVLEAAYRPVDVAAETKADMLVADPRLAQLETGFRARLESDAQKPFLAAQVTLNQSYVANGIARARAAAQGQGNLKEVSALDAEKARVDAGEALPAEEPADTAPALKALRTTYRTALAKLQTDRAKKAVPLYDLYLTAIDAYIAELTRGNKIPEAQKVSDHRKEVAREKDELIAAATVIAAASAPAGANPGTTAPAMTPVAGAPSAAQPSKDGGSPWQTAAKFLVSSSAVCVVEDGGKRIELKTPEDIPSGKFHVIELNFDRLNSPLPLPKADDFQALMGLRDLRRVSIRMPKADIPDEAYAWLAGNEELTFLNLESAGHITSKVLGYLASAKKLNHLNIQHSPDFTGEGLEKMPFAPTIERLDFLNTGLTADGLKALAAYQKVKDLRVDGGTEAKDRDYMILGSLVTLEKIECTRNGFGDDAAEAVAKLPNLRVLLLGYSQITDKGLEKLKALKKLTTVGLVGTRVTAGGVEDFQKAMPQCQVRR